MRFVVAGSDQDTGQPVELALDAADVATAAGLASRKGVSVTAVRAASATVPPVLPERRQKDAPRLATQRRRSPAWLGAVMVLFPFLAPFAPYALLWAGIGILVLVVLYVTLSPTRRVLGSLFHVSPHRPVLRVFSLIAIVLYAMVLFGLTSFGVEIQKAWAAAVARTAAERAEQARLQAEAYERAASLVEQARTAIAAGDVDTAKEFLDRAARLEGVASRAEITRLQKYVRQSTDATWALNALIMLSDDEFDAFRNAGTVPSAFDLEFLILTERAVALVITDFASDDQWRALWVCTVVVIVVIAVRIAWIALTANLSLGWREPVVLPRLAVAAWAGMRGVVSLAAAMSIPRTLPDGSPFPHRDLVIASAFAVVFATLVLQGSTLPALIRWLRVRPDAWESQEREYAVATSASEALRTIGAESEARDVPAAIRERLLAEQLARVQSEEFSHAGGNVDEHHRNLHLERAIRRRTIAAERAVIARLRKSGAIGEGTFRGLERELDLQEQLLDSMPLEDD